jgi:hypothetical protein
LISIFRTATPKIDHDDTIQRVGIESIIRFSVGGRGARVPSAERAEGRVRWITVRVPPGCAESAEMCGEGSQGGTVC